MFCNFSKSSDVPLPLPFAVIGGAIRQAARREPFGPELTAEGLADTSHGPK